ncbi:MAG: glycosyltransferase [Candidatus Peribacteria bacterium]|nr:MAG: glycosyltransferase [Candidatus Peribacteria bacterium]
MKIGIDLMILNSYNIYAEYTIELLHRLLKKDPENEYHIYLDVYYREQVFEGENVRYHIIEEPSRSFKGMLEFNREIRKENLDLMIFFDFRNVFCYKKDAIVFIPTLKDINFPDTNNFFKKTYINHLLGRNIKKAKKIVTFDTYTQNELNEKFNIPDEKFVCIEGFFPMKHYEQDTSLKLNIKAKHNLPGEYIIYSGGNGNNKNLNTLVEAISKFKRRGDKLSLLILDTQVSNNLEFRKQVVDNDIQDRVIFTSDIKETERPYYYAQALGSVFPSLYESFPFRLRESIQLKSRIFASNFENVQEVLGDHALYFNPLSSNELIRLIDANMEVPKPVNYDDIHKKYTPVKSAETLINIIKSL